MKKCCFYQDKVCFLRYVMFSKGINMILEQINMVKTWFEPKSKPDIYVFIGFANFHWQFMKNFNKIAALLKLMLKTMILS